MARNGWYSSWEFGWWRDEKVRYLIAVGGKELAFDYMKLAMVIYECCSDENPGVLDMNDPVTCANVYAEMGMDEAAFEDFLDKTFTARLFEREWYEHFKKVGSERTVAQATAIRDRIRNRINAGKKGGKASSKKRQASA